MAREYTDVGLIVHTEGFWSRLDGLAIRFCGGLEQMFKVVYQRNEVRFPEMISHWADVPQRYILIYV